MPTQAGQNNERKNKNVKPPLKKSKTPFRIEIIDYVSKTTCVDKWND